MKKEREEIDKLGYTLVRLSAVDQRKDPLLQNFTYKTFPKGAGTHGYFRSLSEVREYIDAIKFIRSV